MLTDQLLIFFRNGAVQRTRKAVAIPTICAELGCQRANILMATLNSARCAVFLLLIFFQNSGARLGIKDFSLDVRENTLLRLFLLCAIRKQAEMKIKQYEVDSEKLFIEDKNIYLISHLLITQNKRNIYKKHKC